MIEVAGLLGWVDGKRTKKGRRTRLTQPGEAVFRRKSRLSDKTAERVALGLLVWILRVAVG